jgi:hypothetical protein
MWLKYPIFGYGARVNPKACLHFRSLVNSKIYNKHYHHTSKSLAGGFSHKNEHNIKTNKSIVNSSNVLKIMPRIQYFTTIPLVTNFLSTQKNTLISTYKIKQGNFLEVEGSNVSFSTHRNFTGKTPYYVQNPLKVASNNLKFLNVKKDWDKNLDKDEFIQGSKFAVITVLQQIQDNNFKGLKGLIAKNKLTQLRNEVETAWSDELRRNINIQMEDIQTVAIRDVRTQQIVHNKYLDIDVAVVASVPGPSHLTSPPSHVYLVHATFCRDYTEGRLPDWLITSFKLHMKPSQTFIG